ncbi:MAG: hypothetical protein ACKVOB_13735 [Sphingomonas sp.]
MREKPAGQYVDLPTLKWHLWPNFGRSSDAPLVMNGRPLSGSWISPAKRLEIFARGPRKGWTVWGNQAEDYEIGWDTYSHNSRAHIGETWVEAAE